MLLLFKILYGIGDLPSGLLGRGGREERTWSMERTWGGVRKLRGTVLGMRRGEQERESPEHVFSRIEQRLEYLNM